MTILSSLARTFTIAALLATHAASAANAHEAQSRRPRLVTIRGDRGGEVIRYAMRARKMEEAGHKVRFAGPCASACTLYLKLPRRQTCITRGASFRFHMPRGGSARSNRIAANYLMRAYPEWVQMWLLAQGGLSRRMKTMPYAYASRYMPPCESRNAAS